MANRHGFSYGGPQDYECPACGAVMNDIRAAFKAVPEERQRYKGEEEKLPVFCRECLSVRSQYVEATWIPRRAQHDLLTGGTGLTIDLGEETKTFSSTHEMRSYEAESQRRAANGDGAAISFRALSQNKGNMDRNTLAGSSFETNRQTAHDDLGRTARGRHIGRGVLTREQAERAARGRS